MGLSSLFAAGEERQGQQGGQGQSQHTAQNVLFILFSSKILYGYFGRRMEGPVPAAWILKTKKASAPHGTKAFASAIPPKLTSCDVHSLLRTIMRTPRITGGFPSDPTWENFPFKPPLGRPFTPLRTAPTLTTRSSLWDALCCATLLPHRFVV